MNSMSTDCEADVLYYCFHNYSSSKAGCRTSSMNTRYKKENATKTKTVQKGNKVGEKINPKNQFYVVIVLEPEPIINRNRTVKI